MRNFGIQTLHLLGIGGTGMSSLALHLLKEGHQVSGSDLKESARTKELQRRGVSIHFGDLQQFPDNADRVIVSSAIPQDHPEVLRAKERDIPTVHRSIELSRLFNQSHGIAIAGTHGKTTISALLTHVLTACDQSPSAMVGGGLIGYETNAFVGQGPYFVIEADESDGSLTAYMPEHTVVTSIDDDVNVTASAYSYCGYDQERVQSAVDRVFRRLTHQTRQGVWVCHDHPRASSVVGSLPGARLYGTDGSCHLRAQPFETGRFHSVSTIYHEGQSLGRLRVPLPGHHNVLNALSVVGICLDLGLPFADVAHAIAVFRGIRRRFERLGTRDGRLCVDDYAHNPQKVAAALAACLQANRGRTVAIFQPHRYTRMQLLGDDFLPALDGADIVLLTDVFASGEEPNDFSIDEFRSALEKRAPRHSVFWTPGEAEVHQALDDKTRAGDLVISLGAGSCGQWLCRWLESNDSTSKP